MRSDDDFVPLLDVLHGCFSNPEEVWDGVVQLEKFVSRMARTHAHTEAPFLAVTKRKP